MSDIPESVDWRTAGAVTPVKNEANCGSCWAFSATGALEGAHFIQTGMLLSLSEQQLVDCSTGMSKGCDGGMQQDAFDYAEKKKVEKEDQYPYREVTGKCHDM